MKHIFDRVTGEYVSTCMADPGDRDDVTDVDPPDPQPGYARHWDGSSWSQVLDVRGATYVDADGQQQVWTGLGPAPASDQTGNLKRLKAKKWQEMKDARDAIEFGSFTWDGSTFDSDPVSASRITGAFALALAAKLTGQPFSEEWTLLDNTTRTLSADDMLAVGVARGTAVAAAHHRASTLRAQISAATTAQQVEAIQWSS